MTESCKDSKGHVWEIYKDKADEWRWKRIAPNGKIVGASTEGYVNKQDCISNARLPGMECTPK
jgi:uncharacterized protein YegP (UPF0339 family)